MTDTRSRGAAATETTPLISSSPSRDASSSSSFSSPSTTPTTEDPTTIYARILAENLPWYKRPSAYWLFPIYGLAAVSAGMLISTVGQFRAALLCREYQLRHAPSDSTNLSTDITSLIFQAAVTAASNSATLYGGSGGMEYGGGGGSNSLYAFGGIVRPGPECQTPEIQAYTAKVMALIDVLGNIAAVLSIGYYASLSDRHGRVKVMSVGLINTIFTMGCLFVMGNWWDQVGIPFMTFAALGNGLLGGISIGQMMCLVYAADCTDLKRRRLVFSWLHAGLFWGLAVGPVIGGIIVNKTDNFLNLVYIDAGASILSLLLLVFFLPESLPQKQPAHIRKLYQEALEKANQQSQQSAPEAPAAGPESTTTTKSNPEQGASWHWHMSRSLLLFKPNGRNTNMILLAAIAFLQMLALKGTFSVIILYTNRAFNWTELEDGILFSLSSSVRLLTLLFLIPVLAHFYHKWARKQQQQQQDPQTKHGKDVDATTTTDTLAARSRTTGDGDSEIEHAGNGLLVGIEDSYVASSVEQLGEAALNLSEDEDEQKGGKSERRRPSASSSSRPTAAALAGSSKSSGSAPSSSSSSSSPHATGSTPTAAPTATEDKPAGDLRFDIWMVRAGYVIATITYIGYGLAVQGWQFYLSSALHAFAIISAPSSKALLTGLVDSSQFGAVLGAVQVVESIAGILSPVLISWVYALTVKTRPDFVWYCCSALTGACAVLAFMVRPKQTAVRGTA